MIRQLILFSILLWNIKASDPPPSFQFYQSSLQAFYFIISAEVDGNPIQMEDWIGAFKGNICVGSYQWDGAYTPVPAMGDDGYEFTEGYMLTGDVPDFYVWDASGDQIFHLTTSENYPWVNGGFFNIQTLSLDEPFYVPNNLDIQSFPNPFNAWVRIVIDTGAYRYIEVKIIDINGSLIEKLYSGGVVQGTSIFKWNAENHPSGLYFVQILSSGNSLLKPNEQTAQKILLLK